MTVGDIITILGFFSLSSDQKPCKSFGEKLSVFLVRMTTGNVTEVRVVREQFPNICLTFCWKATARVLLFAHANLEVLPNPPFPKVSLICSHSLERWTHQY